ncbi:MAG: aminodeoxychorismate/anthranilate synthase component II [Lewinellaceae bacterium]|nr:aminodeoxychorismate/anthranilate synthase component II [Lewinellaceae bacterium]
MKILLLDNYDSFTYNLYDYLLQAGAQCQVLRNDATLPGPDRFDAIVLSPGPKRPEDAGQLMDIVARYHQIKPMLGICLGHQAIGTYFGAKLVRARVPVHGKTSLIRHENHLLFQHTPPFFEVMRYHSLLLQDLEHTGLMPLASTEDGELMAFTHTKLPLYGMQFHPESVLTEYGLTLLQNWLSLASEWLLAGSSEKNTIHVV